MVLVAPYTRLFTLQNAETTLIKECIFMHFWRNKRLEKWIGIKGYKRIKVENELLHGQNRYLRRQYKELKDAQDRFRTMRHEMENDYIVELEYLKRKQYDKLEEHYRQKAEFYPKKQCLIDTGNIGMDAILCSKLEDAQKEEIRIELENRVAGSIEIEDWDMSMLLGNLIDNSLEAVRELEAKDKWINIRILTDETAFFLEIRNPYEQSREKDCDGNYLTLKADKLLHGLGLLQVRRIARKYGGKVVFSDWGKVFCAKVFLYMNGGQ